MFWNNANDRFKKADKVEEMKNLDGVDDVEYSNIIDTGFGVGGYGLKVPHDKTNLVMGWCCPKCDRVYSPSVKMCGNCNETVITW